MMYNEKLELPDGSYSVSDIQDSFKYIIENQKTVTDSSSRRTYLNKIKNRIKFKIKNDYYFDYYIFVISETMKLLRGTKNKITKKENSEKVFY